MTRCIADKSYEKDGRLSLYLSCNGHANYEVHGKDIVCSAVSCLCTSLANTLLAIGVPKVCFRVTEGSFFLHTFMDENQKYAEGAFDMAVIGLGMLAEQYPDHVFLASGVSH